LSKNDVITNFALLEYPFMHDGITHEEYEEERDYFIHHYEDYKKGSYVPLWKQKVQKENK